MILRSEFLNSLLLNLGIKAPLDILYPTAVLIGMVYEFLPFMILPLYTSLEKIDQSLLEAAADLGAKPWRAFLRITLPLSVPGMIAGSILVFIPAMGMFVVPDLMGGAKTILVGNLIRNQFLVARDWPFRAATSFLLLLTLVFTFMPKAGFGGCLYERKSQLWLKILAILVYLYLLAYYYSSCFLIQFPKTLHGRNLLHWYDAINGQSVLLATDT
jgi:ABC-type spermidine/putrescine transport system permease subunit I